MVLVEPLKRRLSKGVAGVHGRLGLDDLPRLNGVDSCRLLRLGRITCLARRRKAHAGIGAQGMGYIHGGGGTKPPSQGVQAVCTPFCTPTWRWQSPDFSVCLRDTIRQFPQ